MTADPSTNRPNIATLFARVAADVEQYSAEMQATRERIAALGLDVAFKITAAESEQNPVLQRRLEMDRSRDKAGDKTDAI